MILINISYREFRNLVEAITVQKNQKFGELKYLNWSLNMLAVN